MLSGQSGVASVFQGSGHSRMDRISPLSLFRVDMKQCCESKQVVLAGCFVPNEAFGLDIWRRLQGLKNACYDAGFPRARWPSLSDIVCKLVSRVLFKHAR